MEVTASAVSDSNAVGRRAGGNGCISRQRRCHKGFEEVWGYFSQPNVEEDIDIKIENVLYKKRN
ncbi:hypothetical protein GCM10010912_25870 [Paenibacillus albidus]|uniref:Uncharacterized protein n=1 Tax=Paenibacillus albidus TaxID=2041023 RepID=A0A917FFI7_9BACL|nr:hypothetical protein GCM10010912_25870 [Paenibacillus albidus]